MESQAENLNLGVNPERPGSPKPQVSGFVHIRTEQMNVKYQKGRQALMKSSLRLLVGWLRLYLAEWEDDKGF